MWSFSKRAIAHRWLKALDNQSVKSVKSGHKEKPTIAATLRAEINELDVCRP